MKHGRTTASITRIALAALVYGAAVSLLFFFQKMEYHRLVVTLARVSDERTRLLEEREVLSSRITALRSARRIDALAGGEFKLAEADEDGVVYVRLDDGGARAAEAKSDRTVFHTLHRKLFEAPVAKADENVGNGRNIQTDSIPNPKRHTAD
jgi:hypothetical protein